MRAMSDQIVLAKEPDFLLGALEVSPARRQAVVDDKAEILQPRVMQVLVALAARRSASRELLRATPFSPSFTVLFSRS